MHHRSEQHCWRRTAAAPLAVCLAVVLAACSGSSSGAADDVVLATTTSTQDSGLLDVLVPAFEAETGHDVKPLAVGSGEALELGRRGEADVLLVHSPAAEEELVATGVTGERLLVMHNDFVVVGPPDDPAGVGRAATAVEAVRTIADGQTPFISRGDDSGTHKLEQELWDQAGLRPAGAWYQSSGQGMGQTLRIAAEKRAYTVADRGTHLATEATSGLAVAFEGDPALLNVYHVIAMTDEAAERVNEEGAEAFARWVTGAEAQATIGQFGRDRFGRALFVPDAGKAEDELAAAAG